MLWWYTEHARSSVSHAEHTTCTGSYRTYQNTVTYRTYNYRLQYTSYHNCSLTYRTYLKPFTYWTYYKYCLTYMTYHNYYISQTSWYIICSYSAISSLMHGKSPFDIVLQIDWLIEKKWKRSTLLKGYNCFFTPEPNLHIPVGVLRVLLRNLCTCSYWMDSLNQHALIWRLQNSCFLFWQDRK